MTTGPEAGAPQSADPREDRELLAAHVDGDPDAFAEIVRRHRDRLWAVALRTMSDPEEAADAVQDALLSAYRSAGSYRGEAAVTTWLHRIVVNACLDRMRRRAVRPSVPLPEDPSFHPADPRDSIAERETSLVVLAALDTLPPDQRAAVVLVHIEGHSLEETAQILDCPTGTVKSRCARARAKLLPLLVHLRNPDATTDVRTASSPQPKGQVATDRGVSERGGGTP